MSIDTLDNPNIDFGDIKLNEPEIPNGHSDVTSRDAVQNQLAREAGGPSSDVRSPRTDVSQEPKDELATTESQPETAEITDYAAVNKGNSDDNAIEGKAPNRPVSEEPPDKATSGQGGSSGLPPDETARGEAGDDDAAGEQDGGLHEVIKAVLKSREGDERHARAERYLAELPGQGREGAGKTPPESELAVGGGEVEGEHLTALGWAMLKAQRAAKAAQVPASEHDPQTSDDVAIGEGAVEGSQELPGGDEVDRWERKLDELHELLIGGPSREKARELYDEDGMYLDPHDRQIRAGKDVPEELNGGGLVIEGIDAAIAAGLGRHGLADGTVIDSDSGQNPEITLGNPGDGDVLNMPELVLYESEAPVNEDFLAEVRRRYEKNEQLPPLVDVSLDHVSVLSALRDGQSDEDIASIRGTSTGEVEDQLIRFGRRLHEAGYDVPLGQAGELEGMNRAPFYVNIALRTGLIQHLDTYESPAPDLSPVMRRTLLLTSQGFDPNQIADGLGVLRTTALEHLSEMRRIFGVDTNEQLVAEVHATLEGTPGMEVFDGHPLPEDFQRLVKERAAAITKLPDLTGLDDTQYYIASGLAGNKPVEQIIEELGFKRRAYEKAYSDMLRRVGGEEISKERLMYTLLLHNLIAMPDAIVQNPQLNHHQRLQTFFAAIELVRDQVANGAEIDINLVNNTLQKARLKLGANSLYAAVAQMFSDGLFEQLPEIDRTPYQRRIDGKLQVISLDSIDELMTMPTGDSQPDETLLYLQHFVRNLNPGDVMLFDGAVPASDQNTNGHNLSVYEERPSTPESSISLPHEKRAGAIELPSGQVIENISVIPFNISAAGAEHVEAAKSYADLRDPETIAGFGQDGFELQPLGFYCTEAIDPFDGRRTKQVAVMYKANRVAEIGE